MAITNITEEVEELRARKALEDRIDLLRPRGAAFVLKALLAARHVSDHTMKLALDLADTVRED
jgi:hypothetical protein